MFSAEAFNRANVLIVGDVMLDRYWFGSVERISPEAPVPVILVDHREERAGGAGNVAANIAALGARCTLLSVVGDDDAGSRLMEMLSTSGIKPILVKDVEADTTVKLRILSKNQQLLRADFEAPPAHEVLASCLQEFEQQLPVADAVLISDYAKGGLFHIREMIDAARKAAKPVIIDPKGTDFDRYRGASMITPNLNELEQVVGPCAAEEELNRKATELVHALEIDALLVTRSEHGMSLYFSDKPPIHCAAAARDVYDVTGAGDTVIGACAVAIAAGLSDEDMVSLANTAAGIVVGKLGTATATLDEVVQQLGQKS